MVNITFELGQVEPQASSSNGSVVQFLMSWQGGVFLGKVKC